MIVDVHQDKVNSVANESILKCDRCGYISFFESAEFERDQANMEQEVQDFKMIDQPDWINTMDDNLKHYRKPLKNFIKNVAYKDKTGCIIISVMRGDLDANPFKIAKLLDCGELVPADNYDLANIGTTGGWIHSWEHDKNHENVTYVVDESLTISRNLIGGYKTEEQDAYNVNYGREFCHSYIGDICVAFHGAKCKHCAKGYLQEKKVLDICRISEVHNDNFFKPPLGFVEKSGSVFSIRLGVCSLGISRILGAIAELNHDEKGISWPVSISPFLITILVLGKSKVGSTLG